MSFENSSLLFNKAKKILPGGVNSPVRAFKSVDSKPIIIKKAKGSKLYDIDGNDYIDYMGSWGTALLGHAHEEVLEFVQESLANGLSFGATHENEIILAEKILSALPAAEKIRFVSSGTEACMTAIRLARGYTKRDLIIKFDGHYHGHSDGLLVKAGSGLATLGIPGSPGIPEAITAHTLSLPFNDLKVVEDALEQYKNQVAAIILEPIAGNCGFIRPKKGYLQALRALSERHGVLLIFDEVMTGFRTAWGGVQALFEISPDLTTLAKVIGGGMPLAALAGKAEIMNHLAPEGNVYQAGTLSGNPIAVAAGIKTLDVLQNHHDPYEELNRKSEKLVTSFSLLAKRYGIPLQFDYEGGLLGFTFSEEKIKNYEDTKKINFERFKRFFKESLSLGFYFPPSAYEACFMSLAHTDEDLERTVQAFENFCKKEF